MVTRVPPRAYQFGRSLEDVATDGVEHHVHLADVLQIVGVQVEEGLRAEVERDIRSSARPVPITRAPASRASWTAIEPTPPAAP